jgi:DNA polymerase
MDCKLCETHKTMILGEGNPHAALVFVGKSPDSQKEIQDRPFIGEASLLLNRMIEAMGLKSEQVFIAHIVKDYPSDKNPLQATPPVQINPKVIVALGESAAQTLLQSKESISGLRGKFHPYCATLASMQLMPTFHPSDLIKTPASKRETWSDLQKVAKTLGIEIPKR